MHETELMYFRNYLDRCWEGRQYYKDETNKLLYWLGTGFVALVAASGILGAIRKPGEQFGFDLVHILVFHTVFAVAWFYYLYKQLNADMFEKLGMVIEAHLRKIQTPPVDGFIDFFSIKGHYLGKSMGHGRSLTRVANVLLVILYLGVTGSPIFQGSVTVNDIKINWSFLIATLVFMFILGGGWLLYRRERKRVITLVEADWQFFCSRSQKVHVEVKTDEHFRAPANQGSHPAEGL